MPIRLFVVLFVGSNRTSWPCSSTLPLRASQFWDGDSKVGNDKALAVVRTVETRTVLLETVMRSFPEFTHRFQVRSVR